MRFLFLCLLWCLCAEVSSAQDNFTLLTPKFSMGAHRQGFFTDASLGIRLYENSSGFLSFQSCFATLGVENNYLFRSDFRLTPKIGVEYNHDFFTFRLQNRLYPNKNLHFRQASWQVCPEIGLNFLNFVSLTYGYNFPVTNKDIFPSLGHQIGLNFNFPLATWR
jgi:hypothetical protein